MHGVTGMLVLSGDIVWQLSDHPKWQHDCGLRVQFPLSGKSSRRDALRIVTEAIKRNTVSWLKPNRTDWQIDISELRRWFADSKQGEFLKELDWLQGVVSVEPEFEHLQETVFGKTKDSTFVRFNIFQEDYLLNKTTKLFLSHKGADKPMVRRFCDSLRLLGFDPWIDEEAMPAGTELNRGILQGFKDSCAAIFFITPQFQDEKFLRIEVSYAVDQKIEKGDRFAIITLVFSDEQGRKGVVPDLLHTYVWKEPASELDGLMDILKAMPLAVGPVSWRSGL